MKIVLEFLQTGQLFYKVMI